MSRVGKIPIAVPAGITITASQDEVKVKGPKGELSRVFDAKLVGIAVEGGKVVISRKGEDRPFRAAQGLMRALVNNMVTGCVAGFKKELDINGVGYQAKVAGQKLSLQIGFCHPVEVVMPQGIKIEATTPTHLVISGPDRQLVGQIASNIRGVRPPEPYNAKGIKYSDEVIRRKAGKTVAAK